MNCTSLNLIRTARRRRTASHLSLLLPVAGLLAQTLPAGSGDLIDLSHWSLTLPDANATIISPAQLVAGFTNGNFYRGTDGALVFWSPVTGGTTDGSDYPRCELREMLNPTDNAVNWPIHGAHVLSGLCEVTQVPRAKRVAFAQIHSYATVGPDLANGVPLALLIFDNGNLELKVKPIAAGPEFVTHPLGYVGFASPIQYQLQVQDGVISATVNGVTQTANVLATDPAWAQQTYYFKAGNYCLDNSGPPSEGAKVRYFQLNTRHW